MDARSKLREDRVLKPQKGNKRLYRVGEEVILQNPATKLWNVPAQIISCRTAPDGKVLSYELRQHNGTVTTRHRVFIRPALPETNDDVEGEADIGVAVDDSEVAGPGSEPVSSRLRSRGRAARAAHSNQGSHEQRSMNAEECAHVVENLQQPALSCHDSLQALITLSLALAEPVAAWNSLPCLGNATVLASWWHILA